MYTFYTQNHIMENRLNQIVYTAYTIHIHKFKCVQFLSSEYKAVKSKHTNQCSNICTALSILIEANLCSKSDELVSVFNKTLNIVVRWDAIPQF